MLYKETDNPNMIMGDCNARIGNETAGKQRVMGRHGGITSNTNGENLIDFCIQNGVVIQNSLYQHKDSHKYTREEPGRSKKSIRY